MGGNPFWLPDVVVGSLAGSHDAGHTQAEVVTGATVREQVVGDGIIRLAQHLLLIPGWAPDVRRDDVTQSLEVANPEVTEMFRRRTVPVLVRGEVEAGKAREVVKPPVPAGVHRQSDVGLVHQEGDSIPCAQSGLPPAKVFLAGVIDQDLDVVGGRKAFVGEDSVAQEPAGANDVRGVDELARK